MISQPMAQDTDNRREDQIYDINSTFVTGGLQTDVSEVNQPQGTQRYVLNGIKETMNKDINTLSNDYSNVQLDTTKVPLNTTQNEKDYLLGSIYLNNDEFVLFILTYATVSNTLTQISKLCLFNSVTNEMTFLISDEDSPEENKLHFNEHHQIQGIYRLRRGCDRTIYFTDNFNAPRTINIDKLYNYYDTTDTTAIAVKFNLIRTYNKIPEFEGIEVKEGGKLLPGGYNLTIRLLDDDLNSTDWITTTEVIIISNFDGDTHFTKMKGSTAKETDWQKFGETTKSIKASIKSNTIDTNFRYLQFGLIYANSGDGTVGGVNVSPMIGIEESDNAPTYYTYQFTGAVEYDKDTVESVTFGPTNIGKAKTIVSTQNRLLLGNIESKQVDWCKLQKYASKIASCAEIKYVQYDYDTNNPSKPINNLEDKGYMPGEIYSFGIVYVFDDGTTSPAYHIPGGTQQVVDPSNDPGTPYSLNSRQRPMNVTNNKCEVKYIDRSGCNDSDYWGVDYLGVPLLNTPIRHHRFPTRAEIGESIIYSTHNYECNKIECSTSDHRTYCHGNYYIKIPYWKVNNHYKRNHSSFDIDVYLAVYSENSTDYPRYYGQFSDGNYFYTIERVTKTIDIDDWESNYTYSSGDSYYCFDLGIYNYLPQILGISEQPVLYTRSDGDNGTRYGWETTVGYMKIKYDKKNEGWVEDADINENQNNKPNGNFPLTEDGDNLRYIFDDVMLHGTTAGQYDNQTLRSRYKIKKDKIRFLYNRVNYDGTPSHNIQPGLASYLSSNNIDYYNLSVVNIIDWNSDSEKPVNDKRPTVHPKRDVNLDNCKKQYSTNYTPILGIHFWNIEIPSLKDTNNNKIIGYYIVRNKRDDDNKTILDSAITIPLSQRKVNGVPGEYISYGFNDLNRIQSADNTVISEDAVGFINPEFKYLKKKYKNFTFVKEGYLNPELINQAFGFSCSKTDSASIVSTCSYPNAEVNPFDTDMIIEDVQAGTSYNKKESRSTGKKSEYDNDGFELYSLIRERYYQYRLYDANTVICNPSKIVYLDALDDTIMESKEDHKLRMIHNLSSDNAIGIMELGQGSSLSGTEDQKTDFLHNMNYGYLKINIPNPYGNFRQLPYYKESKNIISMTYNTGSYNTTVFSGDVSVTPMKYWNSVFYNTRVRLRRRKFYVWRIIVGAISTAASIVGTAFASIFTGGAMLSTGIATVKASISLMMSGIKMGKINQLYTKLYFKGLQSTLEDVWTKYFLKKNNPLDDQIQWTFDIANSLWFESTVNQFWRVGTSGDLPDFLEPLKIYNTVDYTNYITNKMTVADNDRNNGRLYQGFASAEYYEVNPDYMRGNIQKAFYHLPIQYDCCSKCLERYPHRIVYSEVSFQEELTDNYTTFLANNYRDIPGETGEITNLFQQDTFLYIQTEEGLWNMPVGTQEIKTQGLTTYLGNGTFFSNEPQRISDAGLGSKYQHGTLITRYGIFFIDDQYGKVYVLQKGKTAYGKSTIGSPTSLIDLGMTYWGKDNVKSYADEYYRKEHDGLHYPHLDNTASEGGMGYLTTYDERNERFILTKKDRIVKPYYLDDNDNKIYPNWIEFNGKYYNIDKGRITPPDSSEGWVFIGFKDNFAIWEKATPLTPNVVPGVIVTPYQKGYKTLKDKVLRVICVDENNNPLTNEQLSQYNINISTVSVDFEINGSPDTSSCDLSGTGIFNSTEVPLNSTVVITNIQSILATIFQNSSQSYSEDSIITSVEEVDEHCYSIITITVTVSVSTSRDCSLIIIKQFNHVDTPERLEELYALFKQEPDPAPDPAEIEIDGLNSDNTMVIIDGTEVAPQEDIYYRDINTGKLYILNNGVLEETPEPEPEPEEPGPEITFTWRNDEEEQETRTYPVRMQNYYLDDNGSGLFVFAPIAIDCEDIDWSKIEENLASCVDETGLFESTPTFYIDNADSTLIGNNEKVLTLVNVEEGDAKKSPENIKQESINKEKSVLRDSSSCSDDQEYAIDSTNITTIPWRYETQYVFLDELTVDDTDIEDCSWTLSFNMKAQCWESFHSYIPNMYICAKDTFYSYRIDKEGLWQHNIDGSFGIYYGDPYQFIVDFVSISENGIATKVWNDIYVIADVKRYDDTLKDYYDINDVFFNKAIVWNHRQCSKELELLLKENQQDENYLYNQIINEDGKITVDRNERNWAFNGFRDNVNHNQKQPMWIKKYDGGVKELNTDIFDFGNNVLQNWYETEIFRGKFLEVMLKFTNFAVVNGNDVDDTDVKIIMYFTIEGRNKTVR